MNNIVFVLFFLFSAVFSYSSEYKDDFAIFCKSFSRDLKRSENLYQSLEAHMKDFNSISFYLVVPRKEEKDFKYAFTSDLKNNKIKKLPKIITEEDLFSRCGISNDLEKAKKNIKWSGWHSQQVAKLCFYKTKLAKHYVTIDSDVYFIKDFSKDLFYQNNILKTAGRVLGQTGSEKAGFNKFQKVRMGQDSHGEEQAYRYFTSGYIRYIFNAGHLPWHDFVPSFQCFDSEKMVKMFKFLKERNNLNEVGVITLVPWEFQWYGTYVQKFHPEEFYLISPFILHEIPHVNENDKYKSCDPSNGFDESYGISYGPHAAGRPSDQVIYQMPDTLKCKVKSRVKIGWHKLQTNKFMRKIWYIFSGN